MVKPVVLWDADQLAAWLHRKVGGVKRAAQEGRLPVPYLQKHPYVWNANDWYRWAEGKRK